MSVSESALPLRDLVHRAARQSLPRRRAWGLAVVALCTLAMVAALSPLIAVLTYTVGRGISAWSVDFFTHLPVPAGIGLTGGASPTRSSDR